MFIYKGESCIPGEKPWIQEKNEKVPGRDFLVLITGIYKGLITEETPVVCGLTETNKVNVIYPNTTVSISALVSEADEIMAQINEDWPLYIMGTAENGETVYINVRYEADKIITEQTCISGKNSDTIRDLCIRVICPDRNTAEALLNAVNNLNWKTDVIVSEWSNLEFFKNNKFALNDDMRGYFCYASVQCKADEDKCLDSLDFFNKISLWESFLKYGFAPLEFEWLNSKISDGTVYRRMEWEISLLKTIENLKFTLVVKENLFSLFDSEGRKLYFSVEHNNSAEKALMKILFPLN